MLVTQIQFLDIITFLEGNLSWWVTQTKPHYKYPIQ